MSFKTVENEERYLKAMESIASSFKLFASAFDPANQPEPPEMVMPVSHKMQEIEALAGSVDRLKRLMKENPELKSVVEGALTKEKISLDDPDLFTKA